MENDEWLAVGNAELEVMARLLEWPEILCRVWKLERDCENSWWGRRKLSGRKVARWFDIFRRT